MAGKRRSRKGKKDVSEFFGLLKDEPLSYEEIKKSRGDRNVTL